LVYKDLTKFYSFENASGFKAEYFNNKELSGNPVISKREKDLNHLWQEGEKIDGVLNANNFSARYETNFKAEKSESLTFELEADDGYRFFINNKLLINAWTRNRWGARTLKFDVKKDSTYALKVEYWQGEGKGNVRLSVGDYQRTDFNALVNRTSDADAYIFVGGISPQLEGEEMTVNYPGFLGGDRTSIMLPQVQTDLMKALHQTGKPLVFVMMTGSAIATPWEAENVPAIVNAWYGGQAAGEALSDVIFGDYNPAGRLPVVNAG
jgi:beta-glucosidase